MKRALPIVFKSLVSTLIGLLNIIGGGGHSKPQEEEKPTEEAPQEENPPEERKMRNDRSGIECGYCTNATQWIKQKGQAKYDCFDCSLCASHYEGPSRFHCEDHKFDICSKCSKVASYQRCGCGNTLVFDSDLDRYCNWCNKRSEKGWKCNDCKYLTCSECKPFTSKVASSKSSSSSTSSPSQVVPSVPLPGDPNKYEKKDFIGEGSFGKVYKCIDKNDGVYI